MIVAHGHEMIQGNKLQNLQYLNHIPDPTYGHIYQVSLLMCAAYLDSWHKPPLLTSLV